MSESSTLPFRVECPECDIDHESEEFDEISSFVGKHHEHTGHDMEWVRTEFEHIIESATNWEVSCDVCDDEWTFGTIEQAENFSKEHSQYTDHESAGEPAEVVVDNLDSRSVKEIIGDLADRYEEGAPEQAVYAISAENDIEIAEIKREVEKLRRSGEIYVPTQGHLRTT